MSAPGEQGRQSQILFHDPVFPFERLQLFRQQIARGERGGHGAIPRSPRQLTHVFYSVFVDVFWAAVIFGPLLIVCRPSRSWASCSGVSIFSNSTSLSASSETNRMWIP